MEIEGNEDGSDGNLDRHNRILTTVPLGCVSVSRRIGEGKDGSCIREINRPYSSEIVVAEQKKMSKEFSSELEILD